MLARILRALTAPPVCLQTTVPPTIAPALAATQEPFVKHVG